MIEFVKSNPNHEGYVESHHIVPRSLGGSNDADNLIDLTARQHFIAHWILWKALSSREMASAFVMMTHRMLNRRGKDYAKAKIQHAESMKKKIPGYKHTEEAKIKMSKARKGVPKSESHKEAMRRGNKKAMLGTKASEATRSKMSESRKGHVWSEEVKEKMRLTALNKPKTPCTHCGAMCAPHTLKRFHMDRCKHKINF